MTLTYWLVNAVQILVLQCLLNQKVGWGKEGSPFSKRPLPRLSYTSLPTSEILLHNWEFSNHLLIVGYWCHWRRVSQIGRRYLITLPNHVSSCSNITAYYRKFQLFKQEPYSHFIYSSLHLYIPVAVGIYLMVYFP